MFCSVFPPLLRLSDSGFCQIRALKPHAFPGTLPGFSLGWPDEKSLPVNVVNTATCVSFQGVLGSGLHVSTLTRPDFILE